MGVVPCITVSVSGECVLPVSLEIAKNCNCATCDGSCKGTFVKHKEFSWSDMKRLKMSDMRHPARFDPISFRLWGQEDRLACASG